MLRSLIWISCFTLLAPSCSELNAPLEPHSMDTVLSELLARYEEETVCVAYRDLSSGRTFLWHAAESMHAASTMKLPVMIAVLRDAEERGVGLETPITVSNTFASLVDDSPFVMPPDEDSEKTLYTMLGQEVSVHRLVDLMITESSNLATNLLIEAVGTERIAKICAELGAEHCRVLRGVQDLKAYRADLNNTTDALSLLHLLQAIHEDRAASPAACAAMREILGRQKLSEMIKPAVPDTVQVLSKTGRITAHDHDAAILVPPSQSPYVLVILTRGFEDPKDSESVGQAITTAIHSWHLRAH